MSTMRLSYFLICLTTLLLTLELNAVELSQQVKQAAVSDLQTLYNATSKIQFDDEVLAILEPLVVPFLVQDIAAYSIEFKRIMIKQFQKNATVEERFLNRAIRLLTITTEYISELLVIKQQPINTRINRIRTTFLYFIDEQVKRMIPYLRMSLENLITDLDFLHLTCVALPNYHPVISILDEIDNIGLYQHFVPVLKRTIENCFKTQLPDTIGKTRAIFALKSILVVHRPFFRFLLEKKILFQRQVIDAQSFERFIRLNVLMLVQNQKGHTIFDNHKISLENDYRNLIAIN